MTKRNQIFALAAAGLGMLAGSAPAAAAAAFDTARPVLAVDTEDSWQHKRKHGHRHHGDYGRTAYYGEPVYANTRTWRGRDGRYYCRKENGTTGLLIGGAVGGLIGNEVAGRGDKTVGTILGVAGGALLGRAIDRSDLHCR